MWTSVTAMSALLVTFMADKAFAYGYNESTPSDYGVESIGSPQSISFSYGPLALNGVLFGNTGSGGISFSTWANGASCSGSSGYGCVNSAIQTATYLAANGVVGGPANGNLFNTVLIPKQGGQPTGLYSSTDYGQGPSCSSSTDNAWDVNSLNSCSSAGNNNNVPNTNYNFPTRGLKVTCKSACGQATSSIVQANWNGLLTQVSQSMNNGNFFAARFTVSRTNIAGSPVAVRCRVTAPNVAEYGVDTCPDFIPGFGGSVTAKDSTFN